MLLFVAFLIVGLLTLLGWWLVRDVFSPFVVAPGVWFAILLLYYLTQPEFYPIQHDFPFAVVLWIIGFLTAAYATYFLLPDGRGIFSTGQGFLVDKESVSRPVLNAYLIITVLVVPAMLYALIKYGIDRGEANLFLYIRMASVEEDFDKPEFGVVTYFIPVAIVLLALTLTYVRQRWFRWVVVVLNIMVGFTTMSKTSFFVVLIVSMFILHRQQKIRLRTIGVWFLVFLVLSVVFQFARAMESQQDTFSVAGMLSLYTMSPSVAFDYYAEPSSATFFGEHVFRFFYAIMHSLGSDIQPVSNILKFVGVPELTNTYTILYPFYTDFGLTGVGVFGALYGCFYTFLYKRSQGRNNVYFVVYAIFLNYLVLEFVQENIFSNLSLILQMLFFVLLPYFLSPPKAKAYD